MAKMVGVYELGPALGSGTFSKVRICTHKDTGKKYAMKIMDKELVREEKAEEQIRREVSIIKNLEHPHVVRLFDVLTTDTHMYLVLELVSGGELQKKVEAASKLDEPTARRHFQDLILGLRYCHGQCVAHRDLKPENLLICEETGMIKISDFGLANMANNTSDQKTLLMQTVCGTPNYVAPEVIKEAGYDGFKADVWSCGVILFFMLSGTLPFEDQNLSVLFNKIERGDYRMARHFSEPVKNLISRILTVDPAQRITLDEIIQHPWFADGGFDASRLKLGNMEPPAPTAVANAVTSINKGESKKSDAPKNTGPIKEDGISLIFRLLGNNFVDLVSTANGKMLHDKRRRTVAIAADVEGAKASCTTALTAMRANPKATNAEFKGFCNTSKGLMTYTMTLMHTVSPKLSIVTVKLGRGDEGEFVTFVSQFIAQLGSAAVSTLIAPDA